MRYSLLSHCALWLGAVCLVLASPAARAASVEARLFAVQVDGKPAGEVLGVGCDVLGTVRLNVAGQAVECTRCRISGQSEADLWYDAQGRLVRQISIEDGHRTLLELKELRR